MRHDHNCVNSYIRTYSPQTPVVCCKGTTPICQIPQSKNIS